MIIIGSYNDDICSVYPVFEEDKQLIDISIPFSGEYLSCIPIFGKEKEQSILIGMGKKELFQESKVIEIFAKLMKELEKYQIKSAQIFIEPIWNVLGISALTPATQGILLGSHKPINYRNEKSFDPQVCLLGIDEMMHEEAQGIISKSMNIGESVKYARDLVNTPGNRLTPSIFAQSIREQMMGTQVEVEILDENQIIELGMKAFMAVGSSSGNAPRLIVLRYHGNKNDTNITALVGKGVTCDTGGYCLKGAGSMLGIKGDMAGAAAVAGAIYALAQNKIRTNVVGIIPSCENRISRDSFVTGDVIESMSGKTIEIANTDAEGRLILADASTYAITKEKASRVVDIATLTGSVVNMFGFSVAGVLSNDKNFFDIFKKAYGISGERYWKLPIYEEYEKMIESKIADIKNMGESYSGTITAGLFIREFVDGKPWIHIDIAGTACVDKPLFEYQAKGATGAGITTLYWLCQLLGEEIVKE